MSQPPHASPYDLEAPGVAPESDFDVKDFAAKILRHWRLIVVTTTLCAAGGLVKYFITPKEYTARALIQIERRSLGPLIGVQNPWLENYWNMEFYPTQERLLQSRGLAELVVRNLHLATDPAFTDQAAPQAGGEASAAADDAAIANLAQAIRGGLSVRRIRDTQLIELFYTSHTPTLAARLANGFAQSFIEMGVANRYETAGQASTFLADEIANLRSEISTKERQLQEIGRRNDIVSLDPDSDQLRQRLQALNQDYAEAQNQRIQLEAKYRELSNGPDASVADSYSGGQVNQLRANLLEMEQDYASRSRTYKPDWPQMVELKGKIDQTQQALDKLIRDNARKAREAAQSEYQAALRQERGLALEIDNVKGQSLDTKGGRLEFLNLEDEVGTRRQLLNQLLQRQSETQVTARLQDTKASNVQVVDTALVPGGPSRPSLRQDGSLGLMLGLALGVGLALLREFMDRTIKTSEELERVLTLPVLAVIPDIFDTGRPYGYGGYGYGYGYGATSSSGKGKRSRANRAWLEKRKKEDPQRIELLPHEKPRLAVSEAYRSLRTAILLSSAEELKVIAVTSAEAGEGKTATATNLAVVMAQLGRQVLIVDGDLRKPRLHQLFGVSNRLGLVNYLTGTAEPETIFSPTEVPNLVVCPSGPLPPNPSELLSSERMQRFLERVRSRFDFIVIDTPPTLAVTDSTLIGSFTDGVVLCCRAGRLLREDARACRDRLRFSEVRPLGAVLNGFRAAASSASYARKHRYYQSYIADLPPESRSDSAA